MVKLNTNELSINRSFKLDYPNVSVYENFARIADQNLDSVIIEEGRNKYTAKEIIALWERL